MGALQSVKLTLVETAEDAADLISWLGEQRSWLGVDVETSGTNLGRDRIRLAQVGDRDHGWAIPIDGRGWGGLLAEVLEKYDRPIAMHNSIFDSALLERDGYTVRGSLIDDTMVMAHLDSSGYAVGLKPVSRRIVDRDADLGQSALKEAMKKEGWTWGTVPTDFPAYWAYGALDPVLTVRIAEKLAPQVLPQYQRAYDIEMGAIDALRRARLNGVAVDVEHTRSEVMRLDAEKRVIEVPCNANSREQLEAHFAARAGGIERLGQIVTERTEKGQLTFNKFALRELLAAGFPEAANIHEWRKRDDLQDYFESILEHEVNGVVHADIRVLGAHKTGRMSISAPALQTLPKSRVGRWSFVAPEDETLLSADFNGMEMRMLAHLAVEESMIAMYARGDDVHNEAGRRVFKVEQPTPAHRKVAKTVGLALVYGAGEDKMAKTAGLSLGDTQAFLAGYHALFPGIRPFQEKMAREVMAGPGRKWGSISTWTGRRIMVPKDEGYKAVNYADQGGCAEVTKLKLAELAAAGLGDWIRIPIHDEILFQGPAEDAEDAEATIRDVMPERELFCLPFEIEVERADRWGEMFDE